MVTESWCATRTPLRTIKPLTQAPRWRGKVVCAALRAAPLALDAGRSLAVVRGAYTGRDFYLLDPNGDGFMGAALCWFRWLGTKPATDYQRIEPCPALRGYVS
jgi:hypothetical protein